MLLCLWFWAVLSVVLSVMAACQSLHFFPFADSLSSLRTKYYSSNLASLVLRTKSIQFKIYLMEVTVLVYFKLEISLHFYLFSLNFVFSLLIFHFSMICLLLLTSFCFTFVLADIEADVLCAASLREFTSQEPGSISSCLFLSYVLVFFKGAMNFNKFLAVLLRCNYRS